jgi:hypothetical protein
VTDADRYAWVDDERLMAACFTIVEGADHDRIVQVFGGDLSTERRWTFEEAFNDYPSTQQLVFDRIDGFVLVAENNGWEGSRPEVAEAASAAGRYAGVYWSVNADMTFVYAIEGVVIAWFDPLLIEHEWSGSDPGSLAELTRDLPFGVGSPRAASFALMERLTGLRIERSWLDAPHRCVDVVPRD